MNKIKETVLKKLGYDDFGDVLDDTDKAIDLTIKKTASKIFEDIEPYFTCEVCPDCDVDENGECIEFTKLKKKYLGEKDE